MVTDADRQAAARFADGYTEIVAAQLSYDMTQGRVDDHPLVQAFAAHREAAERAGAQAERERIIRALGIYHEWCDGWGLTKNLNMAVRVAAECARMVRVLPNDLPADDEDAGDKITKAIRAVSDQERA